MGMTDLEKVIKGLRSKIDNDCSSCSYDEDFNCIGCDVLLRDAISLLKAQEPRLITEDDFENADECGYIPAWCEASDGIFAECITIGALKETNCKYWTSKPTNEQVKAVKWE